MSRSAAHSMSVAEFNRTPSAALDQARQGEAVDVTSRGKVVATIMPAKRSRLGCMEGTGTIVGDVMAPLKWNVG